MDGQTAMMLGLIGVLVTQVVNRFLAERSNKAATPEELGMLVQAFSTHRSFGTVIPIGITVVVLIVGMAYRQAFAQIFATGFLCVLFSLALLQIAVYRRLRSLELSPEYMKRFVQQAAFVQIGNLASISMLAYGMAVGI